MLIDLIMESFLDMNDEEKSIAIESMSPEEIYLVSNYIDTISDPEIILESIYEVLASVLNPTGSCLDAEMIVSLSGQLALSACTLADTLCKGNRSRYAISAHLLHGILCILFYIFLIP